MCPSTEYTCVVHQHSIHTQHDLPHSGQIVSCQSTPNIPLLSEERDTKLALSLQTFPGCLPD